MDEREVQKLEHGVYRIYWDDDSYSLAAVGSTHSGKRWIAPANWTSSEETNPIVATTKYWDMIKSVELIESRSNVEIDKDKRSLNLYEIYVPTIKNDGKPIRTRQHREWDRRVRRLTGGLTIYKPSIGQWIDSNTGTLYKERMIPVRIATDEKTMLKIALITKSFYEQLAVLYYKISNEVYFV